MNKLNVKFKYFIYNYSTYILIVILSILIILYISPKNTITNDTISWYEFQIETAFSIRPDIFKFNKENTLTIRTEELTKLINDNIPELDVEIPINEDQDQCIGYVIIKKHDTNIDIDTSKTCEIMNY